MGLLFRSFFPVSSLNFGEYAVCVLPIILACLDSVFTENACRCLWIEYWGKWGEGSFQLRPLEMGSGDYVDIYEIWGIVSYKWQKRCGSDFSLHVALRSCSLLCLGARVKGPSVVQ